MVSHGHIIIIHSEVHDSLLFRNQEKLVALLVYSSFIRVATSGFRVIPYSLGVVFVFRNEEKLVAILVYSSFRRVATSGFWIIPYSLVVEAESLHIHHSTAAQYSYKNDCDITRVVATERVRNNYSLLESFTLYCSGVIRMI